jgi:hypothetical protein
MTNAKVVAEDSFQNYIRDNDLVRLICEGGCGETLLVKRAESVVLYEPKCTVRFRHYCHACSVRELQKPLPLCACGNRTDMSYSDKRIPYCPACRVSVLGC